MDRREWYSDSDREYACIYHRDDCFQGGIGLLTFTGLKEPEYVDSPEGPLCIAANGYQWLELVPEGGHFALTAMFHDGTLFEQYTDITLRNEVNENGDAAFYDLLLDMVVLSDGTPRVLDRDWPAGADAIVREFVDGGGDPSALLGRLSARLSQKPEHSG